VIRRRAGRLVRYALLLVVVLTLVSSVFNVFTQRRAEPPAGLTFVPTGNVDTRIRTWGTAGPPVILVPGAFETADTFDALARDLAMDHRVYALDLTGTGYSEAVPPYDVDHFADQVLGLIAAEGLTGADAPVLVGHSSGAAVAALATLRSDGGVAGLMVLDGDLRPFPVPGFLRSLVLEPFRTSLLRAGLGSDWLIRQVYDTQCGPLCPELTAADVDQWRRPLLQPGSEDAMWHMSRAGIPSLSNDQLDELRTSMVPKVVAGGGDDPQFGQSSAEATAARIGAPAPTFIAGRHLPMISSPAALADAVRSLAAGGGADR
jgi:pimeloyl-ACP methyl ester carboxylesterase